MLFTIVPAFIWHEMTAMVQPSWTRSQIKVTLNRWLSTEGRQMWCMPYIVLFPKIPNSITLNMHLKSLLRFAVLQVPTALNPPYYGPYSSNIHVCRKPHVKYSNLRWENVHKYVFMHSKLFISWIFNGIPNYDIWWLETTYKLQFDGSEVKTTLRTFLYQRRSCLFSLQSACYMQFYS